MRAESRKEGLLSTPLNQGFLIAFRRRRIAFRCLLIRSRAQSQCCLRRSAICSSVGGGIGSRSMLARNKNSFSLSRITSQNLSMSSCVKVVFTERLLYRLKPAKPGVIRARRAMRCMTVQGLASSRRRCRRRRERHEVDREDRRARWGRGDWHRARDRG